MKTFFNLIFSLVLLCFFSLINPHTTLGGVDLPWSTTYDCDEWNGSPGLNCDGLSRYLSSACSGNYEQITAPANFSLGGGGKGQRHWEGDGQNNNSGGTKIEFNSRQPELWIRWYMRYELGFTWAGGVPGYDKILYITGAKSLVPELSYNEVKVAYAGPGDVKSTGDKGWTYINGGSTGDGIWHCYEIHLKDGSSTGVVEWWIDGVRVINRTGIDMGSGGWDKIVIGSNQNRPQNGRCMAVDFDDIVVSNTGYIGPIPGTNPPRPPKNLRIK